MSVRKDGLAEAQAVDIQAMFEALCRVQSGASANDGPEARLARFAREAGAPGAAGGAREAGAPRAAGGAREAGAPAAARGARDGEDDFPDFSVDPPVAEPLEMPAEPSFGREPRADRGLDPGAGAPPGGERDAILAALLGALGDYQRLLVRYSREFDEALARRARGEAEAGDAVLERLRAAQALLVKYPLAGQAAFHALVREGRRFSETDEGRSWKRRLAGSPLLARARTLFEGLSGGIVSEEGGAVPSAYVDAFVRALDRDLEGVLSDLAGAGERP
ncbi:MULTISPECIES: hypothetical protein [Sorangium]|uniref:Uncharacterized protein n=1 Tax=Sorangium cellulosum TaxID=56 RepID=A0A4P2QTB0_SORCE|nr:MULTISPECIES: hypothetical protein [Sorangium]AUX33505.1 uncharacterized protein SOCE836_056650 [Sorangium cellulosum]WCQ92821.1 hypothetical protein NQZ70_05567 [Sorangium sp. Soce836]